MCSVPLFASCSLGRALSGTRESYLEYRGTMKAMVPSVEACLSLIFMILIDWPALAATFRALSSAKLTRNVVALDTEKRRQATCPGKGAGVVSNTCERAARMSFCRGRCRAGMEHVVDRNPFLRYCIMGIPFLRCWIIGISTAGYDIGLYVYA